MGSLVSDLEFRGLWHQAAGASLAQRLESERLTAYIGFDPTADSLHVGNLLQLCMLRRLQQAGHRPIAVAGGVTGMIGDPGGKSEERSLLSDERLKANLQGIRPQIERFVDLGGGGGLLLDNAQWLRGLTLVDFLRDIGKHLAVNEMIRKDSVSARLERAEQGISYTEFSYMLLQAYDFLHLFDHHDCRLQLGGSDQFGNITVGIELVRKMRQVEVYGLTSPLVLKADGSKFGKTESGTVWLDPRRTSPYALYQFFLRTEDDLVGRYLRFFSFLEHDELLALEQVTAAHPERRQAQRVLARELCALVHGADDAARAEHASEALYSEAIASLDESTLLEVCAEAPTSTWPRTGLDEGVALVDLLASSGLSGSKSQARSAVTQGGVYVNNQRVTGLDAHLGRDDLLFDRYVVLRRGRREYHLVRFE
ncbi:MAG TPA: tyrosine--tRNA ligase [Acidimicrobiales bacterium]|nr:tyrosine--tRNA ligase [Acidimicrobiales bacterium]